MSPRDIKKEVKPVVSAFLYEKEGTGTHTGGSGHMSDISITLDRISVRETGDTPRAYEVDITYYKTTVTEFTIYPDNPPREEKYRQTLYLSEDFTVVESTEKQSEKVERDPGEDFPDLFG